MGMQMSSITPMMADALSLSNQLEWGASSEFSTSSPFRKWVTPSTVGVPGSGRTAFGESGSSRSMGDGFGDESIDSGLSDEVTEESSDEFGDLFSTDTADDTMGDDLSTDSLDSTDGGDGLDFGDLLSSDTGSDNSDLGESSDDMSAFDIDLDTSSESSDEFGDLLGDSAEEANDDADLNLEPEVFKEEPVQTQTAASSSLKNEKATETLPANGTENPNGTLRKINGVFYFNLGNIDIVWKENYHPGKARVTTKGPFKLLHFLEAIDQPGLLEVSKNSKIREHFDDFISVKFTNRPLESVLTWLSHAFNAPYTLKNRHLEI
jgi:hypothetical protein